MERSVGETDGLYRAVFENAGDMIYTHDLEGRFTCTNDAGERLTGYNRAELAEMTSGTIFTPDYERAVREIAAKALESACSTVVESEVATKDGQQRPVEVNLQPILKDGEVVGMQGVVRDISQRRSLERQLEHMASRDYLTGLLNRRRLEEDLQVQLAQARRYGVPGALLFLDLDHFKDVNDSFGHSVGDELLVSVAQLLRERLPQASAVARLGGDEFTIILPRTEIGEARNMAEEVLAWLRSSPILVAGQALAVSGSIGIAPIRPDGMTTAEEVLSHADRAMYQAKESGRNCACVYSPDIDWQARIEVGLAWRKRIAEAMEQNLLTLYAQPILAIRQDTVTQYEMLVRMPDEHGQIINASKFISSAERFGFVQSIDRWAIRRTIEFLAEYRGPVLEVNVSGAAMADEELLPMIREELAARSVDPRRLVVEITESVAIADIHRAQRFVGGLKRLGCRFALDDFGVGFSSFYQLKHLDVDYLKIDGGFIRDLPRDPVDQHLVKAMVEVARALGKETIAEFVGDAETMRLIGELGVDYGQGYHIGRPREATEAFQGISQASRAA